MMGAVQQTGIDIAKLAAAERRLQAPVLHVRDAGHHACVLGHPGANALQHTPGISQMLQHIAKHPAIARAVLS
ncbi:MAG: hypothetical protein ACO241_07580, partial [Burkholderiaceae bacterium]